MNSTLVLGIASIGLALVFRAQSHDLPSEAQRLPTLLIWLVIALAAMMIVEELIKMRRARRADVANADDDAPLAAINWPVLAIFGAASIAYVALIPIAGYLLVTPLFLTVGIWLSKTMVFAKAAAVGVIGTAVIWGVFIGLLGLPIPLIPSLN